MKKWYILFLFVGLTLVYFRHTLFIPANFLLTRHQGTDTYVYMLNASNFVNWIKHGFIPIGSYWVPLGGGFPATSSDQFLTPTSLSLMALYSITHNLITSVRVLMPVIYFFTLLASYWFASNIFKSGYIRVIFAIAYSFSVYGVTQYEHIDLLCAPIFVALTLGFLERAFSTVKPVNIVLTATFFFITYLTHLYSFYFLGVYIVLRTLYELVRNTQKKRVVIITLVMFSITLVMLLPFLMPQLNALPSTSAKQLLDKNLQDYAAPVEQFFMRTLPNYFMGDSYSMYLGLSVVLLALVPILWGFGKRNVQYIFYLLTTLFFLMWSVGHYSLLNVAQLIHNYFPLAYFIRVPGRAMIIGYLTLTVCACMGFEFLLTRVKRPIVLTGLVALIIYCDLTLGFAPTAMPIAIKDEAAYNFIAQQQGDFRVVEVPSISNQMAITDLYTHHDFLGASVWAYGYDAKLAAPSNMYEEYVAETATAQQAAFYGIKYVIVNTNQSYNSLMKQPFLDIPLTGYKNISQAYALDTDLSSSPDYKLVFTQNDYTVYENLLYRGVVYGTGVIDYTYSPNKLVIDTNNATTINISQSYDKNWSASVGTPVEDNSETMLTIPSNVKQVVLTYTPYKKSLLWFLIYVPLFGVIMWVTKRR
jgi:hypothetical protein